MARQRGVRVAVLGEDQHQVSFARRVLRLVGFGSHEIRARPVPDGGGSGEQWVRGDFPNQVALHRTERPNQQVTLAVSIDGDGRSVHGRKSQLDDELVRAGMEVRGAQEPIAIWVPKRNIETWFCHFAGDTVDEVTDYKSRVRTPNLKQAADGFVAEFRRFHANPKSIETLPSLCDAYEELKRILQ